MAGLRSRGHAAFLLTADARCRVDQVEPAKDYCRWHRLALLERAQTRAEGVRASEREVFQRTSTSARCPRCQTVYGHPERAGKDRRGSVAFPCRILPRKFCVLARKRAGHPASCSI